MHNTTDTTDTTGNTLTGLSFFYFNGFSFLNSSLGKFPADTVILNSAFKVSEQL